MKDTRDMTDQEILDALARPQLLLVKAQVLRETLTALDQIKGIDWDYLGYLKGCETAKIEALKDESEVDYYLIESRRITLKEWLDSLDWKHCTR